MLQPEFCGSSVLLLLHGAIGDEYVMTYLALV